MHKLSNSVIRIPDSKCPFVAWKMDGGESGDVNAEWLKFRSTGIGGSDVAAIMGISEYRSPLEVWLEKTGRAESPDLSKKESVEWGNRLESIIRDKFREEHPELKVMQFNASLVSKERPWAHANLDGRVQDENGNWGILEIKTAGKARESDWKNGVPDYYLTQVTHYLSVTGWSFAYVAALIGGQHYVEYRIDRDEDDVKAISEAVDNFWHGFVETGLMPEIVGMPSESRALFALNPMGDGSQQVTEEAATDLFNSLVWDYTQAAQQEKLAKESKDAAAARLRMIIGSNKSVSSDIYRVSWSRYPKSRIDQKRLKEERPDIYEKFKVTTQADGGLHISEIGK